MSKRQVLIFNRWSASGTGHRRRQSSSCCLPASASTACTLGRFRHAGLDPRGCGTLPDGVVGIRGLLAPDDRQLAPLRANRERSVARRATMHSTSSGARITPTVNTSGASTTQCRRSPTWPSKSSFPVIWLSGLAYLSYGLWSQGAVTNAALEGVALVHTAAAFAMLVFIILHIYLLTTGHSFVGHVRPMIDGYDDVEPPVLRKKPISRPTSRVGFADGTE